MENIITKRLILREFQITDLSDVLRYAKDKDLTKYMLHFTNDEDDTFAFLLSTISIYKMTPYTCYERAIIFNNQLIGAVSIYLDESLTSGEIGWILHSDYHRLGIMYEAASALISFVKETTPLRKLTASCDARNIASYKLMEKLGFTRLSLTKNSRIDKDTGLKTLDQLTYRLVVIKKT